MSTAPAWVQSVAYVVTFGALMWFELPVWLDEQTRVERLNGWMSGNDPDWFQFIPFLVLFPFCWFGFSRRTISPGLNENKRWLAESPASENRSPLRAWSMALVVFIVAFGMSWNVGKKFDGLPPAYHDEYSYLIQAETFTNWRWSSPSFQPMPELFDQMHVLNEGKFASRYFPGTGLWIAPFFALGLPWLGHQLAQGFAAMMLFWSGRELSNSGTGLLAGLLFALSPGLLLFSNLLLAHHPTLIGLTLFLWAFLRMMRTNSVLATLLAGLGLAFAMVCRPMTAAGFALPFGVCFVWWGVTGCWPFMRIQNSAAVMKSPVRRCGRIVVMGVPLVLGFVLIFVQNLAITGSAFKTPYQVYTETYTPRHVYGFNNVERGEQNLGPKVIDNYDRWAKNLTPELALANVQTRILNSWRWTLGVVPLLAAGLVFLLTLRAGDHRWGLIGLAVLSLHLAHIPYWFDGIMGWHYVFETAPLWLLIFAEVTRRLFVQWNVSGRWMMKRCWGLFIAVAVSTNLWTIEPVWPARLDRGVAELKFPRQLYQSFYDQIETLRNGKNVVVFVVPDEADRSMDFVTNSAQLDGPVLVARLKDRNQLSEVAALFPERFVLHFDAKTRQFEIPVLNSDAKE